MPTPEPLISFSVPEAHLPSWTVTASPAGTLHLMLHDTVHAVDADAILWWDFGGMEAAIGSVPISAGIVLSDGTPCSLGATQILDEWGDADPAQSPEAILAVLQQALHQLQAACGCRLVRGNPRR